MAASTAVPFPRFYCLPFLMNNHNRSIIHRQLYFRPPPLHGILRLHHHLLLLLLLLLSAVTPYTTAQSSTGPSQNPYGDYNSVSQPLAIIVVVFVCAIFLMGFFSIYIRRCTDDTSSAEISRRFYAYATPAASRGCPRRTPCGLDPSVIESFPIFVYSAVKHLKIGKGALQCAVCITEFEDNETLRLLPKCNHVFHSECIDVWLVSHLTCPVCRAYLEPSPGTQFTGSPEEEIPIPELSELVQDHVSITVQENQTRDSQVIMINEIVNTSKFPRSHSTGHSLVQPGESSERYTLRLPDEVRTQIVVNQRLKQTSSVRGYRSGTGEESSNFSSFFSSFSTANVKTNK